MSLCGGERDKARLIQRLNRVEGQIRGLVSMIEEDRDCMEILRQFASAHGALKGAWGHALEEHLRGCVSDAMEHGNPGSKLIPELIEHLKKMR